MAIVVMMSGDAIASEHANDFNELKAGLLDGKKVSVGLDLSRCVDSGAAPGPKNFGGFVIDSYMIFGGKSSESIAFSLLHRTVREKSGEIGADYVRYRVTPDNKAQVNAFIFAEGDHKATSIGSWTCQIGTGIRFAW